MRFAGVAAVSFIAGAAALVLPSCVPDAREAPGPTLQELAYPALQIVARRGDRVLLAPARIESRYPIETRSSRADRDAARRRGSRATDVQPTLVFESGSLRSGPEALAVTLSAGPAGAQPLRVQRALFDGDTLLYPRAGESPPLHESPAVAGQYAVEVDGELWLVGARGNRRLTRDTVSGIARDTLTEQTREGVRHLYWASTPVWSPDGSLIAYVTNRTLMLHPRGGQEIWLVEVASGTERALLSEPGRSYYPDGWLGSELVFKSDAPGIGAVDVRSGARRLLAEGSAVTVARDRLLFMTGSAERWRARVLTSEEAIEIPDPANGETFVHGGAFSPSGRRVVLEATLDADSGVTRLLYVFDLESRALRRVLQWNYRDSARAPQGQPVWLDDNTLLLTLFDRATGAESSALLRLSGR